MKKPYGVEEWDGYPMPDVLSNRKPLPKDEEDKILDEMRKRLEKIKAAQDEKKRKAV